jgi:hypothetical protein
VTKLERAVDVLPHENSLDHSDIRANARNQGFELPEMIPIRSANGAPKAVR